jgi:hypothetical protein
MVGAYELPGIPRFLGTNARPAVTTNIEQSMNPPVGTSDDYNRLAADSVKEVVARRRNPADVTCQEPVTHEDSVNFEVEDFRAAIEFPIQADSWAA